jgi:hypothetical protein
MAEVFHAEKSICVIDNSGYVGDMNWQQFLPLLIVLGVAVVFVWRSSGKKPGCGHDCNCAHEHHPAGKKKENNAG